MSSSLLLIPKQLPRFEGAKSLLAVVTKFGLELYTAETGVLRKVEEVLVPKLAWGDKDMGVEDKEVTMVLRRIIRDKLLPYLSAKEYKQAYLFIAKQAKSHVLKILPTQAANKVKQLVVGNFSKHDPLELLARLKRGEERRVTPTSAAAQKILSQGFTI